MNKVILMGRLTRDPEVRYAQGENAMAIARFSLAVDRRRQNNADGQTADFINIVAFGRLGEFAEKYLSTVRGLDEKLKTPFFTQTKPIYEIVCKYFTADEKKEAEKIEYAAANMITNGSYVIKAPKQFTDENGVFKIPEGNYERISLNSIDGVQTLVVSPTVNWISCERHSIPVIIPGIPLWMADLGTLGFLQRLIHIVPLAT